MDLLYEEAARQAPPPLIIHDSLQPRLEVVRNSWAGPQFHCAP
jgi:hypothetical protein